MVGGWVVLCGCICRCICMVGCVVLRVWDLESVIFIFSKWCWLPRGFL